MTVNSENREKTLNTCTYNGSVRYINGNKLL